MKSKLENQSVYYEPIKTEKVTRGVLIAKTKYWVGDNPIRIDVEQSGKTEQDAKIKLEKFLQLK